jgi:hypothetical protein
MEDSKDSVFIGLTLEERARIAWYTLVTAVKIMFLNDLDRKYLVQTNKIHIRLQHIDAKLMLAIGPSKEIMRKEVAKRGKIKKS